MEDDLRKMRRRLDISFVQENIGQPRRLVRDDIVEWPMEAARRCALRLLEERGFMQSADVRAMKVDLIQKYEQVVPSIVAGSRLTTLHGKVDAYHSSLEQWKAQGEQVYSGHVKA